METLLPRSTRFYERGPRFPTSEPSSTSTGQILPSLLRDSLSFPKLGNSVLPSQRTRSTSTVRCLLRRITVPRAQRLEESCTPPGLQEPRRGQSDSSPTPRIWHAVLHTVSVQQFSFDPNSVVHSFNRCTVSAYLGSGLAVTAGDTKFSPYLQGDHISVKGSKECLLPSTISKLPHGEGRKKRVVNSDDV